MELTIMMERIKERIALNKAALPGLHKRALELSLRPQPWWNRDFYDWAIKREEHRREA